jgi:acyl carrier protein
MTDLDAGIREVLAATFALDPEGIDDATSTATVAGWDSLQHIGVILALEERFGVAIGVERIAGMTSFAAIRAVLSELIEAPA